MCRRSFLLRARWFVTAFFCALAVALPVSSFPQMMAHPGWRGNGLANSAWWREAIFVRVEPGTDLKGVLGSLDALVSSGADALILPAPNAEGKDLSALDSSLGSSADLDLLLQEASARRMHVVLTLPYRRLQNSGAAANVVRFWLGRGMAGIDLRRTETPETSANALRELRSVADHFTGQRILIAQENASAETAKSADPVVLRIANAGPSGAVSASPAGKPHAPMAVEIPAPASHANMQSATLPLLLSPGPAVFSSNLISADAAEQAWLLQVLALRRSNGALRRGTVTALKSDVPGVDAWLARPPAPSAAQPALMVLRNTSAEPANLHLQAQVTALHVRGVFLRALLRNDGGTGSLNLDRIMLPPNSVVVGEVRY